LFIGNRADIVGIVQDGRYMYINLGSRMESRPVKFVASQSQWPELYKLSKIGRRPLGEAEDACPSRSECTSEETRKGRKTPVHHSLCITI
jgi:hypothetical protein